MPNFVPQLCPVKKHTHMSRLRLLCVFSVFFFLTMAIFCLTFVCFHVFLLVVVILVVNNNANNCLERLVFEMTCCESNGIVKSAYTY